MKFYSMVAVWVLTGLLVDLAPAQAPATQQGASQVSPEARAVLDQVQEAAGKLKSLEMSGSVFSNFDVAGRKQEQTQKFTAAYLAPDKFRNEMNNELLTGGTGSKVYVYDEKASVYLIMDAPKGKVAPGDVPQPMGQILSMQNPFLIVLVSHASLQDLWREPRTVVRLADTPLGGSSYETIQFVDAQNRPGVILLVDPRTHLPRQVKFDLTKALEARGAKDVKSASIVVDYQTMTPDAAVEEASFAWTPPAGAKDASKEKDDSPAMGMVGKPAPDFKLTSLDGKQTVSLADLKGSVVVLDFWATWCGPCVRSLPTLDEVYRQNKEAGVKVFAVNIKEEPAAVRAFVEAKKLSVPVLLDKDGAVAQKYMAQAIPETVVIGKDGQVRLVLVGAGPDNERKIRGEIESALKANP